MGLLDGGLKVIVGNALSSLMLDGTLTKETRAEDGEGGWTVTTADYAIKGMVDGYSTFTRAQLGIPDTDSKLVILQNGVAVAPAQGDKITLSGAWKVVAVSQDPAQATWECRSSRVSEG